MKDSTMRVAIFHLGFFYSGGGEKLVLEEIRGLRSLGHEVRCFAPYVDVEGCFPGVPEMAEIAPLLPPPPKWLPMRDPLWITLSCLIVPLLAWRFRAYDVLLGANQPGCWFAFVVSRLLHKPYVTYLAHPIRILHPRDIDLENELKIRDGDHRYMMFLARSAGRFVDWADRMSVREAHMILANGDHVNQWLYRVYGRNSTVCPAGCHPAKVGELDYEIKQRGQFQINGSLISKPYVLLTNRHVPQKRFEYALWALKSISRSVPGLSMIITGQETEYTEQLKYLMEGLGLKNNVQFVGLVSEKDLSRLYQQAVLYIYPSPEEDFGMGIVEAMSEGTPVVAWRNGGPTVTVKDHETGFLVEPYDTEVFAQRIFALATEPKLAERMGRAGHKRAREMFSYARHNHILSGALLDAIEHWPSKAQDPVQPIAVEAMVPDTFMASLPAHAHTSSVSTDTGIFGVRRGQFDPMSLEDLTAQSAGSTHAVDRADRDREER